MSKRGRWDSGSDEDSTAPLTSSAKTKKSSSKGNRKGIKATSVVNDKPQSAPSCETVATSATPVYREGRKILANRRCRSVDCYEQLNYIDEGTYGMVFRARCKDSGGIYAIKQVKPGPHVGKLGFPLVALREINALLALKHPNIIPVKEMVVGGTDKIFMVMEYCENDVKTVMKLNQQSFSTAEVKRLLMQMFSAVAFMHERGYLHRDLKTSNLLYSNTGRLYICDFGLARTYESPPEPYTPEVVTLWYRCPELLLGCNKYDTALDMWSVGCIAAEIITGNPIFPGEGEMDQINKIFRIIGLPTEDKWPGFTSLPHANKLSWRFPSKSLLRDQFPKTSFAGAMSLSDLGVDLIARLLEMDPSKRLTAPQCLTHDWLHKEFPLPTDDDCMPTFASRSQQ